MINSNIRQTLSDSLIGPEKDKLIYLLQFDVALLQTQMEILKEEVTKLKEQP